MGDAAEATGDHEIACRRWRQALAIHLEIDTVVAEQMRAEMEQLCSQ